MVLGEEVLFAFAAGFLTLFFVGGLARRVRREARGQDFDTEAQARKLSESPGDYEYKIIYV